MKKKNRKKRKTMKFIIDIETDSLTPSVIWCCGIKPLGEDGWLCMHAEGFNHFLESNEGATLYAHNGFKFDYPTLERLWNADFSGVTLVDTLVMSRQADPKRIGGNSLASWGQRLGVPKRFHSDWSCFTKEMGAYCLRDLEVTERLLHAVEEELRAPSVQLEKRVREIIDQQVARGWLLDFKKCLGLIMDLREREKALEAEVRTRFVPRAKFVKEVTPKINKDGTISSVGLGLIENIASVCGKFSAISFPEFNLGSRQQIGEYLKLFGWIPKLFTPTGQPVVDEGTLEGVEIPEAKLIEEYLMVQKRIAMISSWVKAADDYFRVHGQVNTYGAVTYRMTHKSPNMAQVTTNGKPYGRAMRECWIASEGYKLVGTDADALELCMLAHYMNDADYTNTVVKGDKANGTDVHTRNQKAAGLPSRDAAKTFIYAYLYGAGDEKIGSIAGQDRLGGRALKARFLKATPALADLKRRVEAASGRGWLKGLDGRRVEVRSTHAALNTLLQSAGAIIMKRALVIATEDAEAAGIKFYWVGNIHDEFQAEVREDQAEAFAKIAADSIRKAGEHYSLRCPLRGTAKIGNNWAETH